MAAPELTNVHAAIAHLQRLSELFQRRRAKLAASVDLTEQQWEVLEEVSHEHFMPSMFARRRESSAAAVSKTLRQLLDKELITVSVAQEDSRKRNYELTGKGGEVMQRLRQHRQEAIERVWMRLDEKQLGSFNRLAEEISRGLEQLLLPER